MAFGLSRSARGPPRLRRSAGIEGQDVEQRVDGVLRGTSPMNVSLHDVAVVQQPRRRRRWRLLRSIGGGAF